jgi:hypothetical protein
MVTPVVLAPGGGMAGQFPLEKVEMIESGCRVRIVSRIEALF